MRVAGVSNIFLLCFTGGGYYNAGGVSHASAGDLMDDQRRFDDSASAPGGNYPPQSHDSFRSAPYQPQQMPPQQQYQQQAPQYQQNPGQYQQQFQAGPARY